MPDAARTQKNGAFYANEACRQSYLIIGCLRKLPLHLTTAHPFGVSTSVW